MLTGIPSIGVGKTAFAVDGITQDSVKNLCDKFLVHGGDFIELIGKSGKIWGAALKSTNKSTIPIILSQGHKISLKMTIKLVKECLYKDRIPEPVSRNE